MDEKGIPIPYEEGQAPQPPPHYIRGEGVEIRNRIMGIWWGMNHSHYGRQQILDALLDLVVDIDTEKDTGHPVVNLQWYHPGGKGG